MKLAVFERYECLRSLSWREAVDYGGVEVWMLWCLWLLRYEFFEVVERETAKAGFLALKCVGSLYIQKRDKGEGRCARGDDGV